MLFLTYGAALLLTWIASRVVYNIFLSPLRSIPGPFLGRVTGQWLTLVDLTGNRTSTIHRLHQKYGSSVRIGPNEISYSNVDIVKELYGQQTQFMKAPFYETFVVPPVGIFSMRDKSAHSQRRRLLSHAFSQSSVIEAQPIIKQIISKLTSHMNNNLGRPVDMLLWFRLTAFDIVGELFLGQSSGGIDNLKTPLLLEDIDRFFILGGIQAAYPWLVQILRFLPGASLRELFLAGDRIIKYGQDAYDAYMVNHGGEKSRRDLLSKIVNNKEEHGGSMTDRETYVEISNLVFAGTDTTSMTLTYLFWELAKNTVWQQKLRAELTSGIDWTEGVPSFQEICDLPVLDMVIKEALRLHPAAPSSLPRSVPDGGRMLNGVFIPEKTVVSMQCYTTHRDPHVFQNPDVFLPERWLDPGPSSLEGKALYMPFSSGARVCLGKNLAMLELKVITATLVKHYEVLVASGTTEDSMALTDHFLAMPSSGRCDLIFTDAPPLEKAG